MKSCIIKKSTIRDYRNVDDLFLILGQSIGGIKSCAEVYDYLACEMSLTASILRGKCTKIKRIADFEEIDLLPCYHGHGRPLFLKDKYSRLNAYYRNITETYLSGISGRDYAEKTLYCQRNILADFIYESTPKSREDNLVEIFSFHNFIYQVVST